MYGIEFDERNTCLGKWWEELDEKNKTITVFVNDDGDESLVEFPFVYEVCYLCEGTGKHVDPAIDANGISAADFIEDPDFAERYYSGGCDVVCHNCGGKRVVPEIDEENLSEEQREYLEMFRKKQRDDADYARICAMERAMGA